MFDTGLVAETFPTGTLVWPLPPQSWPGMPTLSLPPSPLLAGRSQASRHPVDANSSSRHRPVSPLCAGSGHVETKGG